MVPAPSFLILASHDVRMLNSRSVAVIVNWLPMASTSRFDRMGIVVLRSTTPCVVESSFNSADFAMELCVTKSALLNELSTTQDVVDSASPIALLSYLPSSIRPALLILRYG